MQAHGLSPAPEADRAAVVRAVLADPRVSGVHQLRTRLSGQLMMVQMHVDLDPTLTLEAAHAIVVEAENRILALYPAADILIHADPRGRTRTAPAQTTDQTTDQTPDPAPPSEPAPRDATPDAAPAKGPWS